MTPRLFLLLLLLLLLGATLSHSVLSPNSGAFLDSHTGADITIPRVLRKSDKNVLGF